MQKANGSLTIRLSAREFENNLKTTFEQRYKYELAKKFLPNKLRRLEDSISKIFVSQFINDGDMLIVASQDQRIKIFDTSRLRYKLKNVVLARDVGWSILDVVASPDGEHLVYSSWSDKIHQCKLNGEAESHVAFDISPSDSRFCCFSLRFSPDSAGSEILAGASDCCIYIYNRTINNRTLRIKAHEDDVNTVSFAGQAADIFYTGSDDGLIKVWDRRSLNEEDPRPVACFAGHLDGITYIDSKGDARYLLSNSKDQTIKLWDLRRPSDKEAIRAARIAVAGQSWDYRWQKVSRLKRQEPVSGDVSVSSFHGSHSVLHTLIRCFFSPQFSTGQQMVYCGCASGACVVYDLNTGKTLTCLKGHRACVRDVTWHPYHNEICTSSWDSRLCRWIYRESEESCNNNSDCDSESSLSSEDEIVPVSTSFPMAQHMIFL